MPLSPEAKRAYNKEHYRQNKAWYAARHERRKREYAELRAELAAGGCIRCGEDDPRCLDFHHRDPSTKSFSLGSASRAGIALPRMREEAAKCDVLCSNCHRKEHSPV